MKILFYLSAWALASAIGIACALGTKDKRRRVQLPEAPPPAARDEKGERVRGIIFDCYKQMKKHTPGLHFLTACLSRQTIPVEVGLYALEKTFAGLSGRYDTRPIETTINRLKTL